MQSGMLPCWDVAARWGVAPHGAAQEAAAHVPLGKQPGAVNGHCAAFLPHPRSPRREGVCCGGRHQGNGDAQLCRGAQRSCMCNSVGWQHAAPASLCAVGHVGASLQCCCCDAAVRLTAWGSLHEMELLHARCHVPAGLQQQPAQRMGDAAHVRRAGLQLEAAVAACLRLACMPCCCPCCSMLLPCFAVHARAIS